MARQLISWLVALQQLERDGRQDFVFCYVATGWLKLAQNVLEYVGFAIVLLLDCIKDFEDFFCDVERFSDVEAFAFALLFEVAPLGLNGFLKFVGSA